MGKFNKLYSKFQYNKVFFCWNFDVVCLLARDTNVMDDGMPLGGYSLRLVCSNTWSFTDSGLPFCSPSESGNIRQIHGYLETCLQYSWRPVCDNDSGYTWGWEEGTVVCR